MIEILVSGVEPAIISRLRRKLDGIAVDEIAEPGEIARALGLKDYHLLMLGDAPGRPLSLDVLRNLRQAAARVPVRVTCCLDHALEGQLSSALLSDMAIDRVFFRPFDGEEVLLQIARITGAELIAESGADDRAGKSSSLDAVWERFREPTLKRVELIDEAVIALLEGRLGADQQRAAEREAHKLAGSAGTFGFARSSTIARDIETKLGSGTLDAADAVSLAEQTLALREDLEGARPAREERGGAPADAGLALLVEDDAAFAERLVMEAEGRGIRTLHRPTVAEARSALAAVAPSVALFRIRGDVSGDVLDFIAELEARVPAIPTLALADGDSLAHRVEVARRGARRFVESTAPPAKIIDAVADVIRHSAERRATILAVDDDPHILAALRAIIEPRDIALTTLDDPLRFWQVLEEVVPELIILDIDMPHVTGLELCRVIRSDPRWSGVPVLFLTGRTDVGSIQRAFAAGADDYLGKPIVASELIMRLNNRLDRARLNRELAEMDPLTGIANRRKSSELLVRFLNLARRKGDPFSFAVLDIDRFKTINDTYGHAAGDHVLRCTAQLFSRSLRSEDVVGRWGGEEFTVGLYGASKGDGAKCLSGILASLAATEFIAADGSTFHVTCSGGVAQLGEDGSDLDTLYKAADAALYAAKAAGRDRVQVAGSQHVLETERVDVVIVDDDDALVGLLEHSLRTRGLTVRSFADGDQAAEALTGETPAIRGRVVLLDVDLPGLNGLDVLRRLTRANVTRASKVVMLTARTGEADVLAALDLGAIDHITKPFSVPVLLHKVQVAMRPTAG